MKHVVSVWTITVVCACAGRVETDTRMEVLPTIEAREARPPNLTIDSILETLTVGEKVGQLIMPWLLGNYAAVESDAFEAAATWVRQFAIGGITISVGSPLDAAAKLNVLQRQSRLPLLVAADLEYGAGMRMVGATGFPMPMGVGATGRALDAYHMGRITALEARAVGIHWSFSPVADINSNPDNPIINTRSFGESPSAVAGLVTAYIHGASDHGLMTTAKHFPGHGDTGTDSHLALPTLDACWDRLDTLELAPFRAAIRAGVTAVMTAHVALPCFDGGNRSRPATMMPEIMTAMLRDSLGFDGLAVTDALTMGAVVSRYGAGESAVLAFLAGSDLLLIPDDLGAAAEAMIAAVISGRIPIERLDRSVRRILTLKERAGLFRRRTVPLDSIPVTVGRREHQLVADDISRRALTLITRGAIDRFRSQRGRVALVTYAEETNHSIANTLIRELRAYGDTVNPFRLFPASGPLSYDSARAVIQSNPRVIFAASVRPIAGRGHVDLPQALATLIGDADRRRQTVLVSFGSPYLLHQLPSFQGTYLLAWNAVPANERAVAGALAGGAPITGRAPITLSEQTPRGFGIVIPGR